MAKFKKEVLDKMRSDIGLFAAVAEAMKVKPTSLPEIIKRNGNNLNQFSIVSLVAKYLGRKPETLLERIPEVKEKA